MVPFRSVGPLSGPDLRAYSLLTDDVCGVPSCHENITTGKQPIVGTLSMMELLLVFLNLLVALDRCTLMRLPARLKMP